MSIHNKIDKIGRVQVPPPRKTGAEWLVGVGFRCWLAGYDTGDIACWETGWNAYARVLGAERAKRAVTELACWVRAVRTSASRKIEYYPFGCAGFCRDECMAISLIAASQHHRCPAMRACALALTGSSLVEPVSTPPTPLPMPCRRPTSCSRLRPSPRLPHRWTGQAAIAARCATERIALQTLCAAISRDCATAAISPGRWRPLVISLIAIAPVLAIFVLALQSSGDTWPHLIANVLPGALRRTLELMAGVGALTLLIGTGTAWLVTMYRFPGRSLFQWLLLLPLAIPTYIIAFCYLELFDYSGALQTRLRELFGWHSAKDYWFPDIRSVGGAIFVMSMVLYPYVYITARASFLAQSVCVLEVSRTLGRSAAATFFEVALPLARPALAAGVALALMETLNDIGAVEFFGVRTLTVAIYDTWLDRNSLAGAAQIACIMLAFVFARAADRARHAGQSALPPHHRPLSPSPRGQAARRSGSACRRWPARCRCCSGSCCRPRCWSTTRLPMSPQASRRSSGTPSCTA